MWNLLYYINTLLHTLFLLLISVVRTIDDFQKFGIFLAQSTIYLSKLLIDRYNFQKYGLPVQSSVLWKI